ncbi:MAG TPA: hypothetical protein VD962_10340, partial [Rubricoccaceae bacterium]|nr:hypothetical protein [Rubricoccaceae bacterium]
MQLFAFAQGGAALAQDSIALSASEAAEVAAASLQRPMGIHLEPSLTEGEARLSGAATTADLGNLLRTARDLLRTPSFNAEAYRRTRRSELGEDRRSPEVFHFFDRPRHAARTPEDVDRVDVSAARAFFLERFDVGAFTFLLVGDATPEEVEAIAGATLGRIRSAGPLATASSPSEPPALRLPPPTTLRLPWSEPGARVTVVFAGTRSLQADESAALGLLAALLERPFEGTGMGVTGVATTDGSRRAYNLSLTLEDRATSGEALR